MVRWGKGQAPTTLGSGGLGCPISGVSGTAATVLSYGGLGMGGVDPGVQMDTGQLRSVG